MALITGSILLVGAVASYFAIGALATLAHWVAVAGAIMVAVGLTYNLIEKDYLEFLGFQSELLESASALVFSIPIGVLSFRLFEAIFASIGYGAAFLTVVIVGASIVFSPVLLFNVVAGIIELVYDFVGGDS